MHPDLHGLVPAELAPASFRVALTRFRFMADIGFHGFEVGHPQALDVDIEVWLDPATLPVDDRVEEAWDYDFLRVEIGRLVEQRRYNLQETLARAIYDLVAARDGVAALRIRTAKPDVYPDCAAVGVELASFVGERPHGPSAASTKA